MREHRIAGSLSRHVGKAPTTPSEIRAMAEQAFREKRVIVFLRSDLDAMPAMVRALIDGEARRIYGPKFSTGLNRQPCPPDAKR